MTEDEAKTKWCPFARVLIDDGDGGHRTSANRLEMGGEPGPDLDWPTPRCIASECMAWRQTVTVAKTIGGEPLQSGRAYITADIETVTTRVGYCGLAGKPA